MLAEPFLYVCFKNYIGTQSEDLSENLNTVTTLGTINNMQEKNICK